MKAIIKYISGQFGKPTGIGGKVSTFVMNTLNKKMYRAIMCNLHISENDTILDIGFGNGFLLNEIARQNPKKLLGVEISEDMIVAVSRRNRAFLQSGKIELQLANVQKLPFADHSIDKIYTVNTVYFWENLQDGLREILRVLKPNGVFLNAVYTKKFLEKLPITKYGFETFTAEDLQKQTLQSGFSEVQIYEIQSNKSFIVISKKIKI